MKNVVCGLAVGTLAAVGAASIAMMATEKGRKLVGKIGTCVENCAGACGTAMNDVKNEFETVVNDCSGGVCRSKK